jgi:hypothetical protein
MFGLSGIVWMTISMVLASIVAFMMKSNEDALSVFAKNETKKAADLNGLGTLLAFVYMVIAIFKGNKWYLSPLLFFGAVLLGGILMSLLSAVFGGGWYARDNMGNMVEGRIYNKNVILAVALLQLITAIFAFIAWF